MGRRSQHRPDELREMILDAAERIVDTGGLAKYSAREVARLIGYAPGTLYNMFENLDEILLRVEQRLLMELDATLAKAMDGLQGEEAIHQFADAYLAFAYKRMKLWRLLIDHRLGPDPAPDWYIALFNAPFGRLEEPFAHVIFGADQEVYRKAAKGLGAQIVSVTERATCDKLGQLSFQSASEQMREMVTIYLAGFRVNSDSLVVKDGSRLTEVGRHPG